MTEYAPATIVVNVGVDLRERLEQLARRDDRSLSGQVRHLLRDGIDRQEHDQEEENA